MTFFVLLLISPLLCSCVYGESIVSRRDSGPQYGEESLLRTSPSSARPFVGVLGVEASLPGFHGTAYDVHSLGVAIPAGKSFGERKVGVVDGPSEPEVHDLLREFFFSLSGLKWSRSDGWLQPAVPICDWWGITCLPRNTSKEFATIIALELPSNLLVGTIPPSFPRLSTLQSLDLSDNLIQGSIPQDIGNFSTLVDLRLASNRFEGTVPDSLASNGAYATLLRLDLSGNRITGPLPSSFWFFSRLKYLDLSNNAFNETLSGEISSLTSLQFLSLRGNHFFGPLPLGLAGLSSLRDLDISHNNFTGEIATDLTMSMTSLEVFAASFNNFSGTTCALGYLTNIRKLLVDHNALTGELHPYLYQLTNCVAMDLSANILSGWVPETLLFNLLARTQLVALNLMENPDLQSWEHRIPPFIGLDPHWTNRVRLGSFACNRLYAKASPSTTLMVDPSFFSYTHCNCIRDSYGQPPDQCYECPPGAYCSGSSFFTFDQGWYPVVEPVGFNNSSEGPRTSYWDRPGADLNVGPKLHNHEVGTHSGALEHGHGDGNGRSFRPRGLMESERDGEFGGSLPSRLGPKLPRWEVSHRTGGSGMGQDYPRDPFIGGRMPLGYLSGPVLLYPCPDLSTNSSSCNPSGTSLFYYNSSTAYGIQDNQTLCSKGYDLRLCSFCTCSAASDSACTNSPFSPLSGSSHPGDCSCYYRSGLKCVQCKRVWKFHNMVALVASIWILFVLFMSFVFYCRKAPIEATPMRFEWVARLRRRISSPPRHSGYLKIIVIYLQTLSLVSKDPILTYFKSVTGDVFSLGAICAWPLLSDPYWQLLFYLVLPLALLAGLLLALLFAALASSVAVRYTRKEAVQEEDYVNDHLIFGGGAGSDFHSKPYVDSSKDHGEYSLVAQACSMVLIVYWWFLFGVAFRALSVFNCASDPLSSFLETQPWLGCKSPQWQGLKVLSIIGIVVYLCVAPVCFGILLFVFRNKINDSNMQTALEILTASYRSRVFWYELVTTARRIGLAAVVALVPGSSAFKMSSVCLVLVVGLYMQILFRPFVTKFENVVEELSMVTVLLTYAAQFGFNMRLNQTSTLNIVTIVVNFLLLTAMIYTYISRTFFQRYRFLPWSPKPNKGYGDSDDSDASSLASINEAMSRSSSQRS